MKVILVAGLGVLTLIQASAQTPPPKVPVSTNQPPPVAGVTNKVDIKELMEADSFTNDTGMVMVKISGAMWAGKFEVTQEEYQKVAGANPSQTVGDRWDPLESTCRHASLSIL